MKPIDIIMPTCNRLAITRVTIDELHKRIKTPFRLIIVDDASTDGTQEYLHQMKKEGKVDVLRIIENSNICQAYNEGLKFVESEYFVTSQDDITVPDLKPCIIQQLIDLMERYPDHGGIGLRIQRIPNLMISKGNKDLIPSRKTLSAYFRISRKSDMEKLGENPFGNRQWDDMAFVSQVRGKLGMKCSWTRNLWADHSRGFCRDRGYLVKPRKWGTGIHARKHQDWINKPYPKINPKTCEPLPNQKIYK